MLIPSITQEYDESKVMVTYTEEGERRGKEEHRDKK